MLIHKPEDRKVRKCLKLIPKAQELEQLCLEKLIPALKVELEVLEHLTQMRIYKISQRHEIWVRQARHVLRLGKRVLRNEFMKMDCLTRCLKLYDEGLFIGEEFDWYKMNDMLVNILQITYEMFRLRKVIEGGGLQCYHQITYPEGSRIKQNAILLQLGVFSRINLILLDFGYFLDDFYDYCFQIQKTLPEQFLHDKQIIEFQPFNNDGVKLPEQLHVYYDIKADIQKKALVNSLPRVSDYILSLQ